MRLVTRLARPRFVWLMSTTLAKKSNSRDGDLLAVLASRSLSPSLYLSPSLSRTLSLSLSFPSGRTDVRPTVVRERGGNASVPRSRRSTPFPALRSHLSYTAGRGRDSQRDSLSPHGDPILVTRLSGSFRHPANALDELRPRSDPVRPSASPPSPARPPATAATRPCAVSRM